MTQVKQSHDVYTVHPVGYVQASEHDGTYAVKVLPEYIDALEGA